MIDQHDCKYCHKPATHYSIFRNEYAYLCNEKVCTHRFDVESGYFMTAMEVDKNK